eukprot:s3399_g1.t3
MELLHLRRSHIRVFPQDGTVVIAILNAKTAKGLQQSLSPQEDGLVAVLQYLLDRARPRDYLYTSSVPTFRHEFACLVKAVGLAPADYLPYCLRRGGATAFYQRFGLGRTVVQGRWKDQTTARIYVDDARATLIQLLLPAPVAPLQQHLASFWRVAARGLTQSLGKLAIGELALFCTTAALGCGRMFESTPEEFHNSLVKVLGALPAETLVYVGHDYTVKNLQFAVAVETANKNLEQMLAWAKEQKVQRKYTVPSTMRNEWLINPFLRSADDSMRSICPGCSPVEVFAKLRKQKDNF